MIEILNGVTLYPELKAVMAIDSSTILDDKQLKPVEIDKYKIAPWGEDNNLPAKILEKIEKSEIIGTNLIFNRDVSYGLGPKLVRVVKDNQGKVVDYLPVDSGPEFDFFERNDIPLFFAEQLTDMVTFHNTFCEMIPEAKSNKIHSLRHKEAVFSRWETMNNKGVIDRHFYSAKWGESPSKNDIAVSAAIDEYDALNDLNIKLTSKKQRLIFSAYMPSPGRPYYSQPQWYSIFESGWYDHSITIPALKKAIIQNNMGVKYIIYISKKYLLDICQREGIDMNDAEAVKKRYSKESETFNQFLTGSKNINKAILALKEYASNGNSGFEEKYITIDTIKNAIEGGEYINDIETAANIMCYAMGVHPSLIGATPGKGSSSLSGTDKRELFLMKQALMRPVIDRTMRALKIIKAHNKWSPDILITVPEYVFTTLDKNKTGKEESVVNKV
jgi:hypothetical protein